MMPYELYLITPSSHGAERPRALRFTCMQWRRGTDSCIFHQLAIAGSYCLKNLPVKLCVGSIVCIESTGG